MSTGNVENIQNALSAAGFSVGEVDGVWGRRSIAALIAFQKFKHLTPDGIFGPATSRALFPGSPAETSQGLLPWYDEAQRLIQTREVLGRRNNPVIMDWADQLGIPYQGDDVPWCGLFVAHCVGSTLPQEILPRNPLSARAWAKFGTSTTPRVGAVMVFQRGAPELGLGHVGIYAGEEGSNFRVLGGNQGNAVCFAWVSGTRLIEARWPHTASSVEGLAGKLAANRLEDLSKNEA